VTIGDREEREYYEKLAADKTLSTHALDEAIREGAFAEHQKGEKRRRVLRPTHRYVFKALIQRVIDGPWSTPAFIRTLSSASDAWPTAPRTSWTTSCRPRYRQWTLSLPYRVRYRVGADNALPSKVLSVFLRMLFAWQRRRARRAGIAKPLTGAVTLCQR